MQWKSSWCILVYNGKTPSLYRIWASQSCFKAESVLLSLEEFSLVEQPNKRNVLARTCSWVSPSVDGWVCYIKVIQNLVAELSWLAKKTFLFRSDMVLVSRWEMAVHWLYTMCLSFLWTYFERVATFQFSVRIRTKLTCSTCILSVLNGFNSFRCVYRVTPVSLLFFLHESCDAVCVYFEALKQSLGCGHQK